MKRTLIRSNSFIRAAKQQIKRNYSYSVDLKNCLELLEKDAFDPTLKSHKLKGKLEGYYACSINYLLRIIFRIIEDEGGESILLTNIGTHDEVY